MTSPDGTRIAYQQAGSGPPLILIDAAGHFRANSPLGELAELLTDHFTVVRYDRRGRGASGDTPPYTPHREVEDLAALIGAVGGPAALYGYSSGCLVALHAAAAGLPVRRLALLEPPIEPARDDPAQRAFATRLRSLTGVDAVEFFLESIGLPADVLAGMRDTPHWTAMVSVAHTLAYDSMLSEATDADLLRRVTAPALVLDSAGSTGELTGMAATAAALLPHATHRSLPGQWHGVPATTLAPALTDFLR
ncbi:pimeloyl-ACP methyl ester carboxylesterase [Micromonospora endolithica]|nr:pimeloyl-ACP methyl ester carboxylesterase [Micromonospora endolithica]